MPYPTLDSLPDWVKEMPKHAQEIYQSAWNSAFEQYKDEGKASAVAITAVKSKYEKKGDKWIAKESMQEGGAGSGDFGHGGRPGEVGGSGGDGGGGDSEGTHDPTEGGKYKWSEKHGETYEGSNYGTVETDKYKVSKAGLLENQSPGGFTHDFQVVTVSKPDSEWHTVKLSQMNEDGSIYRRTEGDYAYNSSEQRWRYGAAPPKDFSELAFKHGLPRITAREESNQGVSMKKDLQSKYAEIIQEAGRRNASADSARIKKIVELCQELLSSEIEDEAKTKEALTEADAVLVWLKEQAAMKTEDGVAYPKAAFAYTPSDNVSEWKLRLWEDPEKKVTRTQLGRAAAALSPGGFRGQKVEIPRDDLSAIKRKIRAEYRKLDVEDEDIPKWVKESETRFLFGNFTPLAEAQVGAKGIAKIVVIKPGWGNPVDNHYYSAEMLSQNYKVFEGVKMYADHQTTSEEKERPEGSVKEWVASLKNVTYQEGVGVVGDAIIIEPWMQAKLTNLRDKELLGEMGISIRAAGVGVKGKAEGREGNIVEKITRVRSVDFVTEAGAGGTVQMYESGLSDYDVDVVSLDILRERRPDLVKSIENEVKAKTLQEVKRMSEQEDKIKELEGQVGTLTTERDEARNKLTEAEKAQRKAEAKSKLDEAIGKSELPEAAKLRITERFKDAESAEGIAEAIKAELDYITALKEAGKVKGMGGSQPNPEKDREALKESFKKLHPEYSDSQLEVAIRGR